MTEAERQMMNTIHMRGRILSLVLSMDDEAKGRALEYMEAIMEVRNEQ